MQKLEIENDSKTHWFGMNDFEISLKSSKVIIKLIYVSEPPFGDSYHKLMINNQEFFGFVWGCNFLFPFNQEFIVCSWMKSTYERKTIIINLISLKFTVLKNYYHTFKIENNEIVLRENYDSTDFKIIKYNELLKMIK